MRYGHSLLCIGTQFIFRVQKRVLFLLCYSQLFFKFLKPRQFFRTFVIMRKDFVFQLLIFAPQRIIFQTLWFVVAMNFAIFINIKIIFVFSPSFILSTIRPRFASSAFSTIKSRRGSTTSPISIDTTSSAWDASFDFNLEQRPMIWIHCCFPQLFGVHFTQTLVTLNL